MERMYEMAKADLGVVPQTLNNSNVTGRYYAAKDERSGDSPHPNLPPSREPKPVRADARPNPQTAM